MGLDHSCPFPKDKMKKSLLTFLMAGLFALAVTAQAPNVTVTTPNFTPGTTINAGQISTNFADLVAAIKSEVDPIGTAIASVVPPDGEYMTGSTVWALADGSIPSGVTGYTWAFPDLRGQFLRGIDPTGAVDPAAGRTAGNIEADAFQGHAHKWPNPIGGYGISHDTIGTAPSGGGTNYMSLGTMTIENYLNGSGTAIYGTPRVSTETRPSNVAVYYYIKVR